MFLLLLLCLVRDSDWPEHLEEVLRPVQLCAELHPLEVVGDLLHRKYILKGQPYQFILEVWQVPYIAQKDKR